MKRYRIVGAVAALLALAACGGGNGGTASTPSAATEPAGDITVLTNRTDIVDTVFADYKKTFEAKYPKVKVTFQAITDYEGEVRTRMNTKEYGDVLLIPNSITKDQLPTYFEPLGNLSDLKAKYRFATEQSFDGKDYGIAITGNAEGFVYNKKVWTAAGITEPPKTPADFITALKAIKDKTQAIPLYTNYKDAWPLTQWESLRGGVLADKDATNKLATDKAPWATGKEHFIIDSLLYDSVKAGLTEADPTTTDWETSKTLLGTGKVATMMLGSWALTQMQETATKGGADKADIGYLPFPNQVGGKFHAVMAGDYKNAININSKNKAAAKAWVTWFADESGYSTSQGGIPPLLTAAFPETLKDLAAVKTEYLELNPEPAGKEGLVNRIDKASEILISSDGKYRQRLVDSARGATSETKDAIFADLNKRWADAITTASLG